MSDTSTNQHIVIVGSGFAGLGMAIALKQAGMTDFTVLEQASELGGTWRDNTYPGAACDVPSHLYSFSFEPYPHWKRAFATQPEILAYLLHCAEKYGVRPHIRFNCAVVSAAFDEPSALWNVVTSDGKTIAARVLVSGTGGLSRPAYPEIAGLANFGGKAFHSARWDHEANLEGKTIAVIGTGASAIQVVPELAKKAKRVYLFQRTAPWVMPKMDRELSDRERAIFRRWPFVQQLARRFIYWQLEWRALMFVVAPGMMKWLGKLGRLHISSSVADPKLRARVVPDYVIGCKRILLSNDYYPSLQRENVEVVSEAIDEVRAGGIATSDGKERAVDSIVLCTGFHAADYAAPFPVVGRAGVVLDEAWRAGASAYLGTTVSGFPNLFLLVGPNTGLGHNSMVFMIESQVRYVMSCLASMRARNWKLVDVRRDVQESYNRRLQERLGKTVWASGCKSWYYSRDGKNTTLWPGFTFEFRHRTRRFDRDNYEVAGYSD